MSSLIRTALLIATCVVPHSVRAQSGKPPISPAPLTVRGCEMVLHARNEGSNDLTIDVAASTAQPGAGAWTSILGGSPVNMASALTFVVPANSTSISHRFNTWLECGTKHRYKFTVRRGTKPNVVLEFPSGGAYTTDVTLRLGDLSIVK